MARQPSDKPWLHKATGFWCATVGGKRQYLDKDYRTAVRKLKARRSQDDRERAGAGRDWLSATYAELSDEFLSDVQARKKPNTYRNFRYCLLRALKIVGTKVRVGEMRKFHLSLVERALTPTLSPTTIKDTLGTMQAVFHWAVRNDLLDLNPLLGYQKPRARRRTRVFTPEEFQALLRSSDACFRRFLIALRTTGCRPAEVRSLIWEWVDLARGLWIIPDHKTVTRQRDPRPRIVPLPTTILKLCLWLAKRQSKLEGPVFLNKRGRPYSKDCITCKMDRIRKRAGIVAKGGENVVLYTARHSFGTEAAGRVTDLELAELMGHTDIRTTSRYVHLNADRLKDIRQRVQDRR